MRKFKMIFLIILSFAIIPNVYAADYYPVTVYSGFFHFRYIDANGNDQENHSFALYNSDNEKIDSLVYHDRMYFIPFVEDYRLYTQEDYDKILMLFDEEHRAIVQDLLSSPEYLNPDTYNAYISNLETDDIFYLYQEARAGYTWGIYGCLPVKIVEETDEFPLTLYIPVRVSIGKEWNKLVLHIEFTGEMYYLNSNESLLDIHRERFQEEITTHQFDDSLPSEEFIRQHNSVKGFHDYDSHCIDGLLEGEPLTADMCDMNTLYKNVTTEEIFLNNKINLLDYYDISAIKIIEIEDESILKIENNVVVPKKKGTTNIKMQIGDNFYYMKVIINDVVSENPYTQSNIWLIFIVFILTATMMLSSKFKKKTMN